LNESRENTLSTEQSYVRKEHIMATTEEERVQQVLDNIRWANEACQQYGWNPRTKKIEPMNSYIDPDMGWVPVTGEDFIHAVIQGG